MSSLKNKSLPPLSLPDFKGVLPEHLISVLQMCEKGKGEDVLHNFEEDFKNYLKTDYCIPVSSATSGIHLALLALEVKEKDEVLCPTFTFAASAFPVLYQKATPVFVDSETTTWNISPEHLENAIKNRVKKGKLPKAIVIVHGYGTPAQLKPLLQIGSRYHIPVIEDSANALGSTYNGCAAGTLGDIGIISFNRNKIISGGAGGAVITKERKLAEKVRYYAHQAKSDVPYYLHQTVGYNYGLSPILGEIIRRQLPTIAERIIQRRKLFFDYTDIFKSSHYQQECDNSFSNRWLTVLKKSPESNYRIPEQLEPRRVWKPMHTQPVFKKYPYYGNKESEDFFNNSYCLPFTHDKHLIPGMI